MKFIFPQNYNFKNKLFGVLDYSTLLINVLWDGFIFLLINLLFQDLSFKIFIFIIFCFPLLLISFSGINGENIIYIFSYMIKFIFEQKLFLYKKN